MNAQQLKAAMKTAGVDDCGLAKSTGIHITLIRRYLGRYPGCTGGVVRVGVKNAIKIARALNVSLEQVLYGNSQEIINADDKEATR